MRKIKAEDKSMCETVWMLHCRGLSVTDIKKRLGMEYGAVKDCIFYKWQTASSAKSKN